MGANTREKMIETLAERLSMPRVQISIILALTAIAAFAVSAIMLRVGVTSMTLRYPLAVIFGYFIFLILLRIWIWLQSDEPAGDINLDLPDHLILPNINIGGGGVAGNESVFGGGGDFQGAGAGGSFGDSDTPLPAVGFVSSNSSSSSVSSSGSGLGGIDFDIDDGLALILILIILALVFSALIYVVWIAPILLAELVIDAAVVGALYKPVKNIKRRHWLVTALKKTGIPAIIVVLLFTAAGFIMQVADPDATTIGQFLKNFD